MLGRDLARVFGRLDRRSHRRDKRLADAPAIEAFGRALPDLSANALPDSHGQLASSFFTMTRACRLSPGSVRGRNGVEGSYTVTRSASGQTVARLVSCCYKHSRDELF